MASGASIAGRAAPMRVACRLMRLVRFSFGDRIATGALEAGEERIRVLQGTY